MEAVIAVCVCVMTVLSCIRFVWWVSAIAQSRRDAARQALWWDERDRRQREREAERAKLERQRQRLVSR